LAARGSEEDPALFGSGLVERDVVRRARRALHDPRVPVRFIVIFMPRHVAGTVTTMSYPFAVLPATCLVWPFALIG
jgi:hypothetical protein